MIYILYQIQDCFENIIKKHETVTDNPSIIIYVKKTDKRIAFKIKREYYLELLRSEIMKFFGRTKYKINKDKMMKMCLIYKLLK